MADETELAKLTIDASGVKRAVEEAATSLSSLAQHIQASASSASSAGESMDRLGEHAQGLGFHIGKLRESFFEAFAARDLMWKGLDAIKETVRDVIKDTEEYQQANLKLDAVIRATGDASGLTARQIRELSDEMERTTLFKSEDIESAAAAMATFHSVQGQVFTDAIHYAADLSSMGFGNLSETARNLGRALDEPIQASRMLRTYGIQLTKTQQDQIKTWDALGEKEKEQGLILDILKGKVSGVAEEMDQGLAGAIHSAETDWKNLMISMGLWADKELEHLRGWADEHKMLLNLDNVKTPEWMRTQDDQTFDTLQNSQSSYYTNLMPRLQKAGFSAQQTATPEAAFQAAHQVIGAGAGNSSPETYKAATSMINDLTTVVNLREQAAAAAQKEQWAQEAAAKAAKAQNDADAAAAKAAQAAAAAKAEAKLYQSDADKVHGLRDETIEMKMTNAEIARYEILHNSGNRALAEEAYRLQTVIDAYKAEQKALDEASKAQEEANRKKAEAAQRVAAYIEQLNEESDALQLGDKAPPGGHRAALSAAGGDPTETAAISTAEARLAFYKLIAQERQQDMKSEAAAANRVEALWQHSLKGIMDGFAGAFDKALDGKEKNFRSFCTDILRAWGHTLSAIGAEAMTAKLFGHSAGPGGKSGALDPLSPEALAQRQALIDQAVEHRSGTFSVGGSATGTPAPTLGAGGSAPSVASSASGLASLGIGLAKMLSQSSSSPANNDWAADAMHSGGVVGREASFSRWVPSALYASAPRYHTGLAGDEMPAILRQGESVLTPEQMREVGGGGGDVHVHLNLSAVDGRDAARFIEENQGHFSRIVTDAVQKSRTFSRRMSGK